MTIQLNSVITNSTGPRKSVCYNREIVKTLNIFVIKFGAEKGS